MNLSTKYTSNHIDDIATSTSAEPEDKLKDSFLIMLQVSVLPLAAMQHLRF